MCKTVHCNIFMYFKLTDNSKKQCLQKCLPMALGQNTAHKEEKNEMGLKVLAWDGTKDMNGEP